MELFGEHKIINKDKYDIIEVHIYKKSPTTLQWVFFIENIKSVIKYLSLNPERKFGMVFDIENLGIPNLEYVREYSDIFRKNEDLLEKNLLCSCVYNNSKIIKTIWDIAMKIYTSKKEIIFIESNQNPEEIFNTKL